MALDCLVKVSPGLLIDENLAPKLADSLADTFLIVVHVRDVGLKAGSDTEIWTYARENGFVILTRDSDFHQRSFVHGHPPKIIWLRVGNCSTSHLKTVIRAQLPEMPRFCANPDESFLAVRELSCRRFAAGTVSGQCQNRILPTEEILQ
jgi:predicted nuclease of predicted toxin-antitoxin system